MSSFEMMPDLTCYVVEVRIGKRKVITKGYYSWLMSKQAAIITALVDLHLTARDLQKPLTITIKEKPIPPTKEK
ncbi:MAG: hypothetical protein IMZ61_16400 [Planctomycetes bacterium]|nr:hypothetical protein [Chloroflexota bacterium]MBE3145483.1 hypothetical protein [Planctomycetota bacterium]